MAAQEASDSAEVSQVDSFTNLPVIKLL